MPAYPSKPTLTQERIRWFADYHRANPSWGVFHVALADGNWNCGAADLWQDLPRDQWPKDLREAAAWFDGLTQSQRRRLAARVEHGSRG